MTSKAYTRREFVRLISSASAVTLVSFNSSCRNKISQWRYLNEMEISLLDAIAEQIIPSDDFPGGRWANVSNYIDKQLTSYYRKYQLVYRDGLAAFGNTANEISGKKFEELSFADQTSLMEKMEAGEFKGEYWNKNPSGNFFDMLRQHCMQGFYGSPTHGGNREYISYRMLGLDYPNIIGQNRYNDLSWRTYKDKS